MAEDKHMKLMEMLDGWKKETMEIRDATQRSTEEG